MIFNISGFL